MNLAVLAIDRIKPTVAFTSPANGANVSGVITVAVNAADNDAVASVQLDEDGVPFGGLMTAPPFQANFDTMTIGNGGHGFDATVRDRVGNVQVASVGVNVSNNPPAVPQIQGPAGTVNSGDVLYGGWSGYWQYGVWVAKGRTLQYRVYINVEGDAEGKRPLCEVTFNDGVGFNYSDALIAGPATTGYGNVFDWYSGWYNVPADASHASLMAMLDLRRDSGGSTTMTFHNSVVQFQWV